MQNNINGLYSGLFAGLSQSFITFFMKYIKIYPSNNMLNDLSNINNQLKINLYEPNPIHHKSVFYGMHIAARFFIYESAKSLLNQTFFAKYQVPDVSTSLIFAAIAGSISSFSSLIFNLNSMALHNISNRAVINNNLQQININRVKSLKQMLKIYKWQALSSSFYFFTYQLILNLLKRQQKNKNPFIWLFAGAIAGFNYSLITYLAHFNIFSSQNNQFMGLQVAINSMKCNKLFFVHAMTVNGFNFVVYETIQRYLYFWDNWIYNVA